ncbi:MAG: 30S ribosomal protein S3ae [Candidatus Micrarchaeia archaeon]
MAKAHGADTWKTKKWYSVLSPDMFESKEIAHVLASEEKNLLNRVIPIGLDALTGDLSQAYATVFFRISEVKGQTAFTKLIGHELSRSYLRTLVRRRRNVLYDVIDITTRDGVPLRLKVGVFTAYKVSHSARTAIRAAVREEIAMRAKEMDFSLLEQEVIFRKFAARLYNRAKKIAPIKRVEIYKSEVKEKFT